MKSPECKQRVFRKKKAAYTFTSEMENISDTLAQENMHIQ